MKVVACVTLLCLLQQSGVVEGFTLSHRHHKTDIAGRHLESAASPSSPLTLPPPPTTSSLAVATASSGAGAAAAAAASSSTWRQRHDDKRRELVSRIAMGITALVSRTPSSSYSAAVPPTTRLINAVVDPLGLRTTTRRQHQRSSRQLLESSSTKTSLRTLHTNIANDKLCNLPNDELVEIIKRDGRERQFLFTADLTREIYDENCMFSDGSDLDGAYPIDAWVRGCRFLFDPSRSSCTIFEDTIRATKHRVVFKFKEQLQFHAPHQSILFRPRVSLTGSIIMDRDPNTGLIVRYEEVWDQDLHQLLKRTQWGVR